MVAEALSRTSAAQWLGCLFAAGAPLIVATASAAGEASASATTSAEGGAPDKLSIEQQRALLKGLYGAFWGFKLLVVLIVIFILGLHGACCLFPNYKTSDADRIQQMLDTQRGLPPPTMLQRVRAMFGFRRPDERAE